MESGVKPDPQGECLRIEVIPVLRAAFFAGMHSSGVAEGETLLGVGFDRDGVLGLPP
jgi:hypothetical protein